MKPKQVSLTCQYSGEPISIVRIIQGSFDTFLKKELQNVEKYLVATV